MSGLSRRELLRRLAGGVASIGTIILAQTVLASEKDAPTTKPAAPDERADRLAEDLPATPEGTELTSFLNRAFRNGGGGGGGAGFRNGAFRNW